jgi:phosphoribosylformimino-5-aminoimidazole carboxamide ribotide isomerase
MIVLPAVDILGGVPVQLLHGEYDKVTWYGDNALGAALRWKQAGASWLHVVDLDGARSGRGVNSDAIRAIIEESGLRVQVGGGLRTLNDVTRVLGWGAERAVIGTTAMRDPDLLREICAAYPEQIVVSLDTRGGEVAVAGWTEGSGRTLLDAAREAEAAGAARILFTAIETDGGMAGPDLSAIETLLGVVTIPVIASGGVGSVEHLEALERTGVEAVIVGTALYEGRVPAAVVAQYAQ